MSDNPLGPCNCGPNVFAACGPLLAPANPDQGRSSPKSLLLDGSCPSYAQTNQAASTFQILGWVNGQVGGLTTDIDGLDTTSFLSWQLPYFIAVSINDDFELWKLRDIQGGDPTVTTLPNFIIPVNNPNLVIWVRIL